MKILTGTSFEKEVQDIKFAPDTAKDILRNALYDKYVKYMEMHDSAVSNNLPDWEKKWYANMQTTIALLDQVNKTGGIKLE